MPKFIVERTLPGAGDFSDEKTNAIINGGRAALKALGGRMQWIETYVAQDKIFSIYTAPDEATVREYSKLANLAVDHVHIVRRVIDYTTGE